MNGKYTAYKRDSAGIQSDLITGLTTIDMSVSVKKLSKASLEGITTGTVPLVDGDSVIIYRNGVMYLGFTVSELRTSCSNPASGVKTWKAECVEDSEIFKHRIVLGDAAELTFNKDVMDVIEDSAYNRIIHYIENCYGGGTIPERQIDHLRLPGKEMRGTVAVSAYRSISLDKVLDEIGSADEFYPKVIRNDKTGVYRAVIQSFRDKTDEIIISPEFGNVLSWSRTEKKPVFNAVWVVSGEYSKGHLYVYMEDTESVKRYGRIEQIVTKSDVKVTENDESEASEESAVLTEEDVLNILQSEAITQLKNNGRKRTYSIKAAETNAMAFMDDWQVGDLVTCSIDGERFESQITEVKINYKDGIETVQPTVGDVERGLFGQIFDMLDGVDSRITRKENE